MKTRKVAEAKLPTRLGRFRILGFESSGGAESAVALIIGQPQRVRAPLVRIHSQCLTGDVLGSLRCDCGWQLKTALKLIAREQCGVLIYHLQEGRGIGLLNKLLAYELQDQGSDTVEANQQLGFAADVRDYDICIDILKLLSIKQVRLLSNNPEKIAALERNSISVVERVPLLMKPSKMTRRYLAVKKKKMGHLLEGIT
ncbi:MAG: GTP cyclohydrolase II [Acidobacteriia bacterium]|nr:GTP cyclohydrolase II [Terriglobia bacterium]